MINLLGHRILGGNKFSENLFGKNLLRIIIYRVGQNFALVSAGASFLIYLKYWVEAKGSGAIMWRSWIVLITGLKTRWI